MTDQPAKFISSRSNASSMETARTKQLGLWEPNSLCVRWVFCPKTSHGPYVLMCYCTEIGSSATT